MLARLSAFSPALRRQAAPRCLSAAAFSLTQRVYIEHTDAFDVVFYANLFRFAAHGRESALSLVAGAAPEGRFVLTSVDNARLSDPASLGDLLTVTTELVGHESHLLLLKHTVAGEAASPKPHLVFYATAGFVNAAGALQPLPTRVLEQAPALATVSARPFPLPLLHPPFASTTVVRPYADELGPGGSPSEVDFLRWMERSRTDALGALDGGLRSLQESGTFVVVTRVALRVDPAQACAARVASGDVVMRCTARARSVFIEFAQEAVNAGGGVMAAAEVTCVCVDAATKRLRPPPDSLRKLFSVGL